MFPQVMIGRGFVLVLVLAAALFSGACAAFQPVDPNGPRADAPEYPVGLPDSSSRLEEAALAWYQMSQHYGLPTRTEATLNPYTGTLQSLPADTSSAILLPRIGTGSVQTEEQTRESLRRFIVQWRQLIGAEPADLSLVERIDEPAGIKVARYEQKPFRYPLRGEFGDLTIRFRADRSVVGISSNCIPNADRLQAALSGLTPVLTPEAVADRIKTRPVTTPRGTFTLPPGATVEVRQLVAYAKGAPEQTNGLELYLAWEIEVTNGPIKTIYLDAISDEVIAVMQS